MAKFTTPDVATIDPKDLRDYAILVGFHKKAWTPTARDRRVEDETQQRKGYMGEATFRKRLIKKEWLAEYRKVARQALTFHLENTLPWSDRGYRILVAKNIQRYLDGMSEFKIRAEVLVNELQNNWPAIIEEAKTLWPGEMFDPSDYPTDLEIGEMFGIDWTERPIPSSDDFRLQDLNPAMKKIIQEKMDAAVKNSIREATEEPWRIAFESIQRVVETLKDADKGFQYTMLTKLQGLVDTLPGLNLTDDPRLAEVAEDARTLLGKISSEFETADDEDELREAAEDASVELRKNKELRTAVAEDAQAALDKMAGFMGGAK